MKINPNDPWYPNPYTFGEVCPHSVLGGCPACHGVTIRLKFAAMAMQGILAANSPIGVGDEYDCEGVNPDALKFADDLIDRANRDQADRDEGKPG